MRDFSREVPDPLIGGLKRLAEAAPLRVRVRGGSMEPLLPDGSFVEVAPRRLYWPGDILAFRSADGRLVVHRLLGFAFLHGRLRLITRGDARRGIDTPVAPAAVVGRAVAGEGVAAGGGVPLGHRLRALARFGGLVLRRLAARARRRSAGLQYNRR